MKALPSHPEWLHQPTRRGDRQSMTGSVGLYATSWARISVSPGIVAAAGEILYDDFAYTSRSQDQYAKAVHYRARTRCALIRAGETRESSALVPI